MRELGNFSLFSSLIFSLLSAVFYSAGFYKKEDTLFKSAKRALLSSIFLIIISSVCLVYLLLTKDYSIEYVAHYVNNTLNLLYTFSAWWAGMEGSLLFWVFILGVYVLFVFYENRKKEMEIERYSYFFLNFIILFFLILTSFFENPFKQLSFKPPDGQGLNPLLQNYWMLIHPVTLYLGYVGFSIPFVYGVSSLILKKDDKFWVKRIRKWTIISWLFLSVGIVFGGRWSYLELGWGGYWAWDPVENASFLPWLTATAFLHTIAVQKKEEIFKRWNYFLIFLTFFLVILGTYITRSGILSSVHAFAESRIGPVFITFLILITAFFIYLFITRYKSLEGKRKIENIFSLEGNFYILSLILILIMIIVTAGTFYPIFSELFTGQKFTLGPSFFNSATVPFFLILVLSMALCPNLSLKKFNLKKFIKKSYISIILSIITLILLFILGIRKIYPLLSYTLSLFLIYTIVIDVAKDLISKKIILSKYMPYLIHSGIVITVIGITGSSAYKVKKDVALKEGEKTEIDGFVMNYKGIKFIENPSYEAARADVEVISNGKTIGLLHPEMRFYKNWKEPSAEMDVLPGIKGDLYAVLKGFDRDGTTYFEFHSNPLIHLVWNGIIFVLIGGILILIRRKK